MRVLCVGVLCLTGCSSVSETFDSAPGQGVGAKPITVVNHMVNEGQLKGSALPVKESYQSVSGHTLAPASMERLPEKTIQVWLAPYVDAQGNLHEASRVHTVLQPSRWLSPAVEPPQPVELPPTDGGVSCLDK